MVAELQLQARTWDGDVRQVELRIGDPYETASGSWGCPIALDGLRAKLPDVQGADAFQALCFAVDLLRQLLREVEERGGELLRDGKPFVLKSYSIEV